MISMAIINFILFCMRYNVGVSFEADLRVIFCPHTDKIISGLPLLAYHRARF
jgi:hypothetical protein